jgi:uncharacterized damage-inducible protein DinB
MTSNISPATESARFADQLERSLRGGAWHGPSLSEALADLTAAEADFRLEEDVHTIRELVFHIDFWIQETLRRIETPPDDRPDPETDWPAGDVPAGRREATFQKALAQLEESHRQLLATVLALDDASFGRRVAGSDPTLRGMLLGLLQHNAYHGGQIVLLARAARSRRRA